MDSLLGMRLNNLNDQNKILEHAEGSFLLQEAELEALGESIFLSNADYGNVAERKAIVRTNPDYTALVAVVIDLKKKFNFEKRRFDILQNAFFAEHSSFKREAGLIQKEHINT